MSPHHPYALDQPLQSSNILRKAGANKKRDLRSEGKGSKSSPESWKRTSAWERVIIRPGTLQSSARLFWAPANRTSEGFPFKPMAPRLLQRWLCRSYWARCDGNQAPVQRTSRMSQETVLRSDRKSAITISGVASDSNAFLPNIYQTTIATRRFLSRGTIPPYIGSRSVNIWGAVFRRVIT